MTRATTLIEVMASVASSLEDVEQRSDLAGSDFEIHFTDIRPGSRGRQDLQQLLAFALAPEPSLAFSELRRVEFRGARVVAHFERGDGTLEQQLHGAARGECLLPLPFLWSVRVIARAALASSQLPACGFSGPQPLSTRSILTVDGESRLNTARLRSEQPVLCREAQAMSLTAALAACLGAKKANKRLLAARPVLPAALLQFVDGASTRVLAGNDWHAECESLVALAARLQGGYDAAVPDVRRSTAELVRQQLSLLPALLRVEGAPAVDAFFAERAQTWHARNDEHQAALASWRRERTVTACPKHVPSPHTDRARREATSARVAQARFEQRRGRVQAALLLAIDAAIVAPDSPEAWLALAEIRGDASAGARALCLGQAICAARGHGTVLELAREQVGLRRDAELAGYFRAHGDYVLAAWLEAGRAAMAAHHAN